MEVAFHSAWTPWGEAAVLREERPRWWDSRRQRRGGKRTSRAFGEQQVILAGTQLGVPFMGSTKGRYGRVGFHLGERCHPHTLF